MSYDLVTWLREQITERRDAALIISDGGFAAERWDTDPRGQVNPERMAAADGVTMLLAPDTEPYELGPSGPRCEHWTPLYAWERENCEPESARVLQSDMPVALVNNGRREIDHISRNDPRDTIARCEAELAILDMHPPFEGGLIDEMPTTGTVCRRCAGGPMMLGDPYPCRTVRLLASGYQYRPGYQEAWRP